MFRHTLAVSWRARAPRRLAAAVAAIFAVACSEQALDPGDADFARTAVASVTVTPSSASGTVGQSGQFSAVVKDIYGNTVSRTVNWRSSDTTIVTVNSTGYATAVGVGSARVIASAGGRSGYASVTVTGIPVAAVTVSPGSASGAVGDSGQFTATLTDANGNVLTGRAVTWTSSNTSVATVSSTGMAYAVSGGSATITAASEGVSGSATVTVTGAAAGPIVGSVSVTPGSASGAVGDSGQFTATVLDTTGNVLTDQVVTWTSSNTAVFTVSQAGMAHAVGAGSGTLTATAGGKSGTAAITVSGTTPPPPPPPPPASGPAAVTLNPASASLSVGATQLLNATVTDAAGNILSGQTLSWTSSNPTVATVIGGLVTGLLAGNATITATSGGVAGSAAVTVTSTVTPPPPPPSSGTWANAPGNYTTISEQPFNVAASLGWNVIWNPDGNGSDAIDLNAPFSPSGVWQVKYPVGFAGGSAPATVYYDPPTVPLHFYTGMYWKASSPWQGHNSDVNKIQFAFIGPNNASVIMEFYGTPGGPYAMHCVTELPGDNRRLPPNVQDVPVTLGQWHKLEWLIDVDAHRLAWWMDGVLIGDYRDIVYPSTGVVEYKISPTWGGTGDVKSETDYYWYDHVILKGY